MNLTTSLTLKQFQNLIATVGDQVTIIGQGEPGCGKSATLKQLAHAMPTHTPCYIDCTLLDLGDFALPYTTDEQGLKVTRFAPNARFGFQSSKPVIIMLDEIGKAMKSVKNVLLTLMLEHRIGDVALPEGSIVFGTTNLTTDGVGDSLEAHARNRVCFVNIAKPHAGFNADGTVDDDSWGRWALDNDIDPAIIGWVREYPHALASYTEGESQRDNPYIFNPLRAGQNAFVTPRSLEKASDIAKQRDVLGDALTLAALAGTVGEAAARDMEAFFRVVDSLPTWASIITDPASAKVPTDITAKCLLVIRAVSKVDAETFEPWLEYLQRLDTELQAMFCISVAAGSSSKQPIAVKSRKFIQWATENHWIVS